MDIFIIVGAIVVALVCIMIATLASRHSLRVQDTADHWYQEYQKRSKLWHQEKQAYIKHIDALTEENMELQRRVVGLDQ